MFLGSPMSKLVASQSLLTILKPDSSQKLISNNGRIIGKIWQSAGPSLEGHQGCGPRVQCLFLPIAVIAIQLTAYAFMFLEDPETHGSPPPDPGWWIWDFVKNRFVFSMIC